MAVVTMRQLLDAGVHFGHQTRRWNPKMKRFIFTERNGNYVIDLQQTLTYIDKAYEFIKETVAHGGTVLFIGTKRQAQEAIAEQATRVSMPYVNQRWLGGMLTNFQTVHKRLLRLKDLESMETSGGVVGFTKKEILLMTREEDKMAKTLGGIRDMTKVPSAVWIVDTKKEHIAVGEARKLNIPVVAVLDTNCDPDEVDYPVPGNDDAIRSAALLTKVVAEAVAEGLLARSGGAAVAAGEEPLAEWERELLETGTPAVVGAVADAVAPIEAAAPVRTRPRTDLFPRPCDRSAMSGRAGGCLCHTRTGRNAPKMANYSAADVKKLRELTGAGFMDCKKALEENEGDFDKAIEFLRIKNAKNASKRAERTTAEGMVAASGNALIELNSETDFVAKNDDFQGLANKIATAAAELPAGTSVAELLSSPLDGGTVEDTINDVAGRLGEKLVLNRFVKFDGQTP